MTIIYKLATKCDQSIFVYFKYVFTLSTIFSFACGSANGSVQPAALTCPPPLKIDATSDTLTYSLERSDALKPFSDSLRNIDTSTPSKSLPISTNPSWSPCLGACFFFVFHCYVCKCNLSICKEFHSIYCNFCKFKICSCFYLQYSLIYL